MWVVRARMILVNDSGAIAVIWRSRVFIVRAMLDDDLRGWR
jgi:hypothetical protein